ncbi:nuclear transport factor 2 family protein [Novosphingobium sp.]|uniref:nuclear transport factor 2 family protein n=1 Tax=Novosphingobium sp. TaxID=1874826 RepID=UPI00286E1522|nr:nuclear transport factor 2 family protein [Novosphingobium sp.]
MSLLLLALVPVMAASGKPHDNRAIITDFARMVYTERDVAGAFEKYVTPDYIQHNPGLPDGREAAVAALAPMFADRVKTFTIKRIVVEGGIAVIHIHVRPTPEARGAAVFDMYRLKNGKIVEHWDAIQPIPGESKNRHPMF